MNAKLDPQQPTFQAVESSSASRPQSAGGGQPSAGQPQGARATQPQRSGGGSRQPGAPTRRSASGQVGSPQRLVSLDAYRGLIMVMLAASGFGILQMTALKPEAPVWQELDWSVWQQIGYHFGHTEWKSNFAEPNGLYWGLEIGVSFWDLIQPAFIFVVGVAMPFSYARRQSLGHSAWQRATHAVLRALVLVLLGVFLSSLRACQTNWEFVNVLSQIGLAYLFAYALMGRKFWIQLLALVVILVGYWAIFYSYTPPEGYDYAAVGATDDTVIEGQFASWSKNGNAGHNADVWLLNKFPRREGDVFRFNPGGYVTLNFVPSIATMLLGVFCGQLLHSDRRWWQKFLLLVLGGAACMGLGLLAAQYACPIVKRIWTPSWVLFSGGWVIWMLAAFYLLVDLCRLRWLAFPLVIVGMNSIIMYMMGQLMRPWTISQIKIHFLGILQYFELRLGINFLADNMYGYVVWPTAAFVVFWLIALWLYRQKIFVKI